MSLNLEAIEVRYPIRSPQTNSIGGVVMQAGDRTVKDRGSGDGTGFEKLRPQAQQLGDPASSRGLTQGLEPSAPSSKLGTLEAFPGSPFTPLIGSEEGLVCSRTYRPPPG
eukprot:763318-Hanusia_phi.AAC.9